MTATSSMQRLWLAALCLLAAAVPCGAEEVKVIDRKPVAHGAEVVLELVEDDGPAPYYRYSYRSKAGIDWVFYRQPVEYKGRPGGEFFEMNELPSMKFNDHRVSLFQPYYYDCVVVTLDLDPTAPKVYRDQFFNSYGGYSTGAELKGVDELELTDLSERWLKTKKLRRDRDGTWQFAGIPYEKNLWSTVSAVPLPSMQELVRQHEKSGGRKSVAETSQHVLPLPTVSDHDPITILPNIDSKGWLRMTDYEDRPQFIIKQERLKGLHGIFCRPQITVALAPALTGGRDFSLPSMTDLIIPPENRADCDWDSWDNRSLARLQIRRSLDSSRPTAADLPCFATDYDKTIGEISEIYDLWKEYSATRLLKSMRGAYDPGFLEVIEWQMARTGGNH